MRTCQRCSVDLGPRPAGRRGPDPMYCDACRVEVRRAQRDATRPAPKPRRQSSLPSRSCKACGAEFAPARCTQIYCSRKCRYHGMYEARKASGRIPNTVPRHLTCTSCGREFVQAGLGRPRRYCPAECARKRGRVAS